MAWLKRAIVEGMQTCITVRLRSAPALETMESVARIWVAVFESQPVAWSEELDLWRIRKAFLIVLGESEIFPTPKKVLDCMPPRKTTFLQLPKPEKKAMPENIRAEMNRIFRMTPSELCAETNRILNDMRMQK
jgi:hypothetical protein